MEPSNEPGEKPIERLLELMRTLRSEKGCPWDREQTLQSLKPFLLEECYEAMDALESGDRARLCDELGDVLLQIVFQSQLTREEGSFSFDDVATAISDKLVRRHPHVFGEVRVSGSAEVTRNWEAIKKGEKGDPRKSAVDGVPRSAPALHKAQQIQKRAARVGFDWDTVHQVVDKVEEEVGEVKEAMASGDPQKVKEEIGDLLFAAVNLSRFLGHSAEEALEETIAKFTRRFQGIEQRLHAQGRKMTECKLPELDAIWNEIKAAE